MNENRIPEPTGRVATIAAFMRRGYTLEAACVVTCPLDADRRDAERDRARAEAAGYDTSDWPSDAERARLKVSYLHYAGTYGHPYRVSRTFDTAEGAQEFVDVNAMVAPLPGVRVEVVR